MKSKELYIRNYGLDLLKIISVLFVIILHYQNSRMGGLLGSVEKGSLNYNIAYIVESFTIIACNIFVMITGYNLSKSDRIKYRKIVDIILLLIFYGILIYVICILLDITSFNKITFKSMLKTINSRWFIDVYILLYLIHPFINKIINNISKKNFEFLLIVCIFFFSIWSSIIIPSDIMNLNIFVNDSGYGIANFVTLYLIGAYIRFYKDDLKINKIILLAIYIILAVINGYLAMSYKPPFSYNFIINIINTVCLFMIFKNLRIKNGKLLSKITSTSLAVYIIHENKFIRKYMYKNIFKTPLFYSSNYLLIHMLITACSIFLICTLLELVRKFVFDKTINKVVDKIKCLNTVVKI